MLPAALINFIHEVIHHSSFLPLKTATFVSELINLHHYLSLLLTFQICLIYLVPFCHLVLHF
ncbi:hypothetical protein Lalb_Chr12g0196341 [Lupinus albus]|uniref:Uncharacterized protein n=1 Tax=Lupinus albus TaxID=3870 RepID=A0A6A4PLG1_LUPAL|nr:hypothetical protein Lalb_Chr12g0196341 [Lupinus albus]